MGKTRIQMRNDLALDLKITVGTELSAAELNRCIEVAVADFSRFLPRERTYAQILDFTVTDEEVIMPKDTDLDGVLIAEDLTAVDNGSNTSINGQPDVPRPLTATITDANNSLVGLTITAYGTDRGELAVEETFHWLRGGSKTIVGKKYFKNVYMIYVDQIIGAGAGDTLAVGWGLYTDVWVDLANKPLKWGSEASATDEDDNALVRDTDFFIDYTNGRIRAVVDGDIAAEDTVTISYTKNQLSIDLSGLADFIRYFRVEYPVGNIPQSFHTAIVRDMILTLTGDDEMGGQVNLADKKQIRVQYDAYHVTPNDYAPGTVPVFLENTVLKAAAAYALFILAYKAEHQAAVDLASARTYIGDANTEQANMTAALANAQTYLVDNSEEDAIGILEDITDNTTELRDKVNTALNAAATSLGQVAANIALATDVRANYLTTTNYADGATEPSVKAYLETGDALINNITEGGEDEKTAETYALFAQVTKEALIGTLEQDRMIFAQHATASSNAALAYVQEAAQRLANIRTHIEESQGYVAVSAMFTRAAEARIAKINVLLVQASRSIEAAGGDLVVADRYKANAIDQRDEVWAIWRDKDQYIGESTMSSLRQPAGQ